MVQIKEYLRECAEIASKLSAQEIQRFVSELERLRSRNGKLYIAGLGGSAANASHAANDFRKLCGIKAVALNDNIAELTARANDEGWGTIYTGALIASSATEGDALLVLSVGGGSDGVSKPLIDAVDYARNYGMRVLGIVGRDGGHTYKRGHCVVLVPTVNEDRVTAHAESFQSVILHCVVSSLQIAKTKW